MLPLAYPRVHQAVSCLLELDDESGGRRWEVVGSTHFSDPERVQGGKERSVDVNDVGTSLCCCSSSCVRHVEGEKARR